MTTSDIQELKELILNLDKKMDLKFAELDKKMDLKFAELDRKIDVKFAELQGEIKVTNQKIEGVKEVMQTLDKRVGNEELISRTVFAGLILAAMSAITKYFVFDQKL